MMMRMRLPSVISNAKQALRLQSSKHGQGVPKGHVAVYVGEQEMKRYVVPLSYLDHPTFQDLLKHAEEEFGFHHPMGGLTIPCKEEAFINITTEISAH